MNEDSDLRKNDTTVHSAPMCNTKGHCSKLRQRMFVLVGVLVVVLIYLMVTSGHQQGVEETAKAELEFAVRGKVFIAIAEQKDCPQARVSGMKVEGPLKLESGEYGWQGTAKACDAEVKVTTRCADMTAERCSITIR